MAEAAVKEPSMEDILSSIRKIISEEGDVPGAEQTAPVVQTPEPVMVSDPINAPQMSDVLDEVRASESVPEPEPVAAATDTSAVSGNDAATIAASLAGIAKTIETGPETSISENVAEPAMEAPVSETQETSVSLTSIAEAVTEQAEIPSAGVEDVEVAIEPQAEVSHVAMADATPAPKIEIEAPEPKIEAPEAPVSAAAVETMVEEEMAFKGALMSPSSNGEVSNAFDRLKRSVMDDVDAKTEAILRPMLREWLDENLPNMVERLVREEIERVARGV